jgi:ribosome biogenesis protein NSA2
MRAIRQLTFSAELKTTFQLPILGVKKNPQSPLYTSLGKRSRPPRRVHLTPFLGVLTKGTIIEVNVSELGMVTTGGKVVWSSE